MSRAAQGYSMYKNSEELQQLIVARHALPVRELHRVFDTVDFYHWGEDDAGRRGCVPEQPPHWALDAADGPEPSATI